MKRRQSCACGLSGLFATPVVKVGVHRAANKKERGAEQSVRTSFDKGLHARGENLRSHSTVPGFMLLHKFKSMNDD